MFGYTITAAVYYSEARLTPGSVPHIGAALLRVLNTGVIHHTRATHTLQYKMHNSCRRRRLLLEVSF